MPRTWSEPKLGDRSGTTAHPWHNAILLRRVLPTPQHRLRALLVGHAVGIADRFQLQAPGRLEIEDRLAGGRAFLDREYHAVGDALAVQIGFGGGDVVDVERDVEGADVAVLRA